MAAWSTDDSWPTDDRWHAYVYAVNLLLRMMFLCFNECLKMFWCILHEEWQFLRCSFLGRRFDTTPAISRLSETHICGLFLIGVFKSGMVLGIWLNTRQLILSRIFLVKKLWLYTPGWKKYSCKISLSILVFCEIQYYPKLLILHKAVHTSLLFSTPIASLWLAEACSPQFMVSWLAISNCLVTKY